MTQRAGVARRAALQGLLAGIFLLPCHSQEVAHQSIVARINGQYAITFGDIQQYVYDSHLIYKYRRDKATAYRKAVDEKIMNQLKLIDFFALNLDENTALIGGALREINEELVIRYYETQFYARYVNDDSMRSAFQDLGKEVLYRQIVLVKPKAASQEDLATLRSRAERIRDDIRNGADFSDVARTYSTRSGSSRPGDVMPPLTWRMSLSSNDLHTVFHLAPGGLQIIESRESISIVNVVDVRTSDVPPYDVVKDDIHKALDQKYGDVALKEFERAKKDLVDESTAVWNARALQQLVQWSALPRFYESAYSDTVRTALAQGRNPTILTYAGGRVDLSEYLRLLNDVLIWPKGRPATEAEIKRFILEAVRTDVLVAKANALHLKNDIFHAETKNPVIRNDILRLYDRYTVEDRIPAPTPTALRALYEAHRESLFYQPAKVNIYAVIDSSATVIERAQQLLAQNVPFERLGREIVVKTYVRHRDGTVETFLENEPPYLGEAAFRLGRFETSGPITYVDSVRGTQYALIKCMSIQEEKQLSYKDVDKTITEVYTTFHRDRLTRAAQDHLRKKYTVTVYTDVLHHQLASMGIGWH